MSIAINPDYKKLLDRQTWTFIEQTDKWYPPNTIDFSLERQRKIYNDMCREFHKGYPDGVTAMDDTVPYSEGSIPIRRYSASSDNNATRIIYFHGGGFIVGGLESHDDICAELCTRTGLAVTSVDYRLAPEHLHPAAFNDSLAATIHECKVFRQSAILCGDSAGGNIAAAIAHTLRDNPAESTIIKGQVLIYPGLGGQDNNAETTSYTKHANAPMLTTRDVNFYASIRTGYKTVDNIVTLSPLRDTNFSGLPETFIFSAECDPLCDDGKDYCNAIINAGGSARLVIEIGLVHGYLRARHSVDRARTSFDRIVKSIVECC